MKRLRLGWWLAACLPLLAGCVRPADEDARRITFAFWGSARQQKAEEEIVAAFERAHPGARVDILQIPHSRYQDKVQAMMIAQAAPDVIMVSMLHSREWAARGALVDLTGEMHALADEHEIMPVPWRGALFRGRVYSLPVNAHGPVTYVNLDAFRAAGLEPPPADRPLTWRELLEIAPRLSRRHGDPQAPTDYAVCLPPLINFLWQHGARLFDDLERPTRVTIDTPEAVAALELMREFMRRGYAVPPEPQVELTGLSSLFRDGRVALFFQGRWVTPDFADGAEFAWDVRPFPAGPHSAASQHGFTGLAVWAGSARQETAREFVRFYASMEGARLAMKHGRTVPVYRELAESDEFLALRPPESMRVFPGTMEEGAGSAYLYAPGTAEVARLVEQRAEQAFARPDLASERIIQGLAADLERWLRRKEATGLLEPRTPERTPNIEHPTSNAQLLADRPAD